MGSNAIRCSHNPASPAFLDACDRLGMLVMDENRLMGSNQEHFDLLRNMIIRDRNHPCIILWSIGNEEWAIEGNVKGTRIAATMQAYARTLDSTRLFTAALSGGWGYGISKSTDVVGFNYIKQGNIDEYHKLNPNQPCVGTEESTTSGTRGIYQTDKELGVMAPDDRTGKGACIETGWKFYDERPFLSGIFFWTGFDYKGEPNPLGWPAVSSQFGIIDACGFPKDIFYYLKSWWTPSPVLYVCPHWNWKGKEGEIIKVWAYSNCNEVELFLNKKSLGKKKITKNEHLEWPVKYMPGTLLAKGYINGKEVAKYQIETSDAPQSIQLQADRSIINADGEDVAVITISAKDLKNRLVATADNTITFELQGAGKIIGVGNGNSGSHEPDKFVRECNQMGVRCYEQTGEVFEWHG